jgi:hypothetical protein
MINLDHLQGVDPTMPPTTRPTPNKLNRYYANLSVYYYWLLVVEAWLKNRSLSEEAGSLLSAKLMQRKPEREEMLNAIATEMGITRDELWQGIIRGTIGSNFLAEEDAEPADDSES